MNRQDGRVKRVFILKKSELFKILESYISFGRKDKRRRKFRVSKPVQIYRKKYTGKPKMKRGLENRKDTFSSNNTIIHLFMYSSVFHCITPSNVLPNIANMMMIIMLFSPCLFC